MLDLSNPALSITYLILWEAIFARQICLPVPAIEQPMSTLYAELFTRLSVHPVVWMVLALFSSTAAFKESCGINASVQLLRIAFLLEIVSVYGLSTHLHV